jgi:hypothetical protein
VSTHLQYIALNMRYTECGSSYRYARGTASSTRPWKGITPLGQGGAAPRGTSAATWWGAGGVGFEFGFEFEFEIEPTRTRGVWGEGWGGASLSLRGCVVFGACGGVQI